MLLDGSSAPRREIALAGADLERGAGEQARHPREDFFTGAEKNCRYDHLKWGGGKIDVKLLCKEDQATQTMELSGNYEPDSYQMAMTAMTEGGTPAQAITMKMEVAAERIGECPAKQG